MTLPIISFVAGMGCTIYCAERCGRAISDRRLVFTAIYGFLMHASLLITSVSALGSGLTQWVFGL